MANIQVFAAIVNIRLAANQLVMKEKVCHICSKRHTLEINHLCFFLLQSTLISWISVVVAGTFMS